MNPTRRGLLEGAARAFADNGLRRSTMQSIAAAAGVAKATLYNHFRTKDDVARALLAVELDRLTDLAGSRPPAEAADAAVSAEQPAAEESAVPVAEPALALVGGPARSALRRGETVSLAA